MKIIRPEESKNLLSEELGNIQDCRQAVDRFINFYDKFKVKESLGHAEEDMMLFQYGKYNWDGTGDKFEFNLTRQFEQPDSDEFLQLSMTLHYDPAKIGEISSYNSWSTDSENTTEWKNLIELSDGFMKAQGLKPWKVTIELNET